MVFPSGTSNTSANSSVSKVCDSSLGATSPDNPNCLNYLGNAVTTAGARNRCDRTVTFDSNQDYRGFPLQAKDADITSMLTSDLAKDKNLYVVGYEGMVYKLDLANAVFEDGTAKADR